MITRGDITALVTDLVRDSVDRLSPAQIGRALDAATEQYSRDRPRRVVRDLPTDAPARIATPADARGVVCVEYPIGQMPPALLDDRGWLEYEDPHGPCIALLFNTALNDVARVTLLVDHTLTDTGSTIPKSDVEAVASYAAAVLHDQIAAATSGDVQTTIQADAIDHASRPTNFAARAERLRARYYDLLGIDPKRTRPASAMGSVQPYPSTGSRWLLHRRGRR